MPVIITIELLGEPGTDVYKELSDLMQESLGWDVQITGENGVVAPLPSAIYAGETELKLVDLANDLLSEITTKVWSKGARVLVVRWLGWAGAGTA